MRKYAGPQVKIKAAGGVRTLDGLLAVKEAGAERCGHQQQHLLWKRLLKIRIVIFYSPSLRAM
jgi:deoxyribose-phosphate aldolase